MTITHHDREMVAGRLAGARINQLLWEQRITKTRAAEVVGVGGPTFGKKLRGEVPITLDELMTIADLLGVQAGDLIPSRDELRACRDSNPKPSDPWTRDAWMLAW